MLSSIIFNIYAVISSKLRGRVFWKVKYVQNIVNSVYVTCMDIYSYFHDFMFDLNLFNERTRLYSDVSFA